MREQLIQIFDEWEEEGTLSGPWLHRKLCRQLNHDPDDDETEVTLGEVLAVAFNGATPQPTTTNKQPPPPIKIISKASRQAVEETLQQVIDDEIEYRCGAKALLNSGWDFTDSANMMTKKPKQVIQYLQDLTWEFGKFSLMAPNRRNYLQMIIHAYRRSNQHEKDEPDADVLT